MVFLDIWIAKVKVFFFFLINWDDALPSQSESVSVIIYSISKVKYPKKLYKIVRQISEEPEFLKN